MHKTFLVCFVLLFAIVSILFISKEASAFIPISFENSWKTTRFDDGGLLNNVQTITVSVNSTDTITVFQDSLDNDLSTTIDFTISDNGGNNYIEQFESKRPDVGTVDDQTHVWSSVNSNATTLVTITRINGTIGGHFSVAIIIMAYHGVKLIGDMANGSPNSAFPAYFITATNIASWAVSYTHFFGAVTMPPGGFNEGIYRADTDTHYSNNHNMGADNDNLNGNPSGNGRDCDITEICIYPNLSASVSQTFFIMELVPEINPVVITLPATDIQTNRAIFHGSLTDLGFSSTIYVWFDYGINISMTKQTIHISKLSPTLFSAIVNNLFQNTTYYFRAHAESLSNSSLNDTGDIFTFTTITNVIFESYINFAWLIIFLIFLILILYGGWWIRKRRNKA